MVVFQELIQTVLTVFCIFLCPPVACYIMKPYGFQQKEMDLTFPWDFRKRMLIFNVILTFLFYLPGVIHAMYHFIEMQKLVE